MPVGPRPASASASCRQAGMIGGIHIMYLSIYTLSYGSCAIDVAVPRAEPRDGMISCMCMVQHAGALDMHTQAAGAVCHVCIGVLHAGMQEQVSRWRAVSYPASRNCPCMLCCLVLMQPAYAAACCARYTAFTWGGKVL